MTAAAVIPLPAVQPWRGGTVQVARPYQPRTGEAALLALEGLARRETPTLARHLDAALQARRDGPARRRWGVAATTWALWGLFRAGCPADEIRSAIGEAMAEQESKLRTACDRFPSAAESIEPVVDAMVAAVVIGIAPEHVDALRVTCRILARHGGLRAPEGDKLSQEQIAEVVGLRPNVISGFLYTLRDGGQIAWKGGRQHRRYRLLVEAPPVPFPDPEERPARVPSPDGRLTVADIGELLPGGWRKSDHAAARILARLDRTTLEKMIAEAHAHRVSERPSGARRDRVAIRHYSDANKWWWNGHLRPAILVALRLYTDAYSDHEKGQVERAEPASHLQVVASDEPDAGAAPVESDSVQASAPPNLLRVVEDVVDKVSSGKAKLQALAGKRAADKGVKSHVKKTEKAKLKAAAPVPVSSPPPLVFHDKKRNSTDLHEVFVAQVKADNFGLSVIWSTYEKKVAKELVDMYGHDWPTLIRMVKILFHQRSEFFSVRDKRGVLSPCDLMRNHNECYARANNVAPPVKPATKPNPSAWKEWSTSVKEYGPDGGFDIDAALERKKAGADGGFDVLGALKKRSTSA